MFSNIFIKRPITSIVLSLSLLILGGISLVKLPISEYPQISPPTASIRGVYSGASSSVVEDAVTTPIENQVNGVPGMSYIKSSSANDGSFSINIVFDPDTNIDIATLDVQNRVSQAQPLLPEEIKRTGVSVTKASSNFLQVIGIYSDNHQYDQEFIDNYANIYIKNALSRIKGVGKVQSFGKSFAMRIWLDPQKMARLNVSPQEVVRAIRDQNIQMAPGSIGTPPVPKGQAFEYNLNIKGRLAHQEEFKEIIINTDAKTGALIRLKDIASVELGKESYSGVARYNKKPSAGLAISQTSGGNALETSKLIEQELKRLEKKFPPHLKWSITFDSTSFVKASIESVVYTFLEALFLVVVVVFLFLQSWRATLIPILAIPVSIIGTFIFFALMGFSINTLNLFAMVLAIGIVVDDAIVVVEAVQHHIDHNGLSAKEASLRAMKEVGGPVIAIALILCAVFVPVAFVPGIAGGLYRQFAATIAVSVVLSALVALTLSPALCSLLLKPNLVNQHSRGIYKFFHKFNKWFEKVTVGYGKAVQKTLRKIPLMVILLIFIYVGAGFLGKVLPSTFLPDEDRSFIMINAELPAAASADRTAEVTSKIENILLEHPAVSSCFSVSNFSLFNGTSAPNYAAMWVMLKPWNKRTDQKYHVERLVKDLGKSFQQIKGASIMALLPSSIPGLGTTGGFSFMIKQGSGTIQELEKVKNNFLQSVQKRPEILYAYSSFRADNPELSAKIDREKAKKLGVDINELGSALRTFLGGEYVNDITLYNRTFKVYVQAHGDFRGDVQHLSQYHLKSNKGMMIPLSSLISIAPSTNAIAISHYNLDRSVEINGQAMFGKSSGDAINALKETAEKVLPEGYSYEFSGLSKEEIDSGNTSTLIFGLSIVFVFLFLSALYESWSVPFAVLLSVPIGTLGAFASLFLVKQANSIYAQIGLITLIGLAAKNAILIVEFCKLRYEQGVPLAKAAQEAAMLRLRPILMTSLAFILGVTPLVFSKGAGAAARSNLGYTVFGGMTLATALAIFFVPMLFVWIVRLGKGQKLED